jgi:hypothetical protein
MYQVQCHDNVADAVVREEGVQPPPTRQPYDAQSGSQLPLHRCQVGLAEAHLEHMQSLIGPSQMVRGCFGRFANAAKLGVLHISVDELCGCSSNDHTVVEVYEESHLHNPACARTRAPPTQTPFGKHGEAVRSRAFRDHCLQ